MLLSNHYHKVEIVGFCRGKMAGLITISLRDNILKQHGSHCDSQSLLIRNLPTAAVRARPALYFCPIINGPTALLSQKPLWLPW